ncbi:MAG: hypothetical protein H0W88_06370 [Parachlamydiaceae bacterium]|nr:hypothetical protein [Parachlamydiaceae bacterium]
MLSNVTRNSIRNFFQQLTEKVEQLSSTEKVITSFAITILLFGTLMHSNFRIFKFVWPIWPFSNTNSTQEKVQSVWNVTIEPEEIPNNTAKFAPLTSPIEQFKAPLKEIKTFMGNGQNRVVLPDNSILEGEFKDGLLCGEGTHTLPNSKVLKGEFKNGMLNGKGKTSHIIKDVIKNKEEFVEGTFVNNKLCGTGSKTLFNGDKQIGEFLDDNLNGEAEVIHADAYISKGTYQNNILFNGKGRQINPNGTIYEGEILDGLLNGKGKAIISDITYEGTFIKSKMNGEGKAMRNNGMIVAEGHFKDNLLHGPNCRKEEAGIEYFGNFVNGRLTGKDGTSIGRGVECEGVFLEGLLHGKGVRKTPDGTIYDGIFRYGKLNGKGTVTFLNGTVLDGFFKDDCLHGEDGTKTFIDGDIFHGRFEGNNMLNGQGTIKTAAGEVHVGVFQNDRLHGMGKIHHLDDIVSDGYFVNGRLNQGFGKLITSDSRFGGLREDIYVGDVFDGRPHGQGKKMFANGNFMQGRFAHGVIADGIYKIGDTTYEGMFNDGYFECDNGTKVMPNRDIHRGIFKRDKLNGGAMANGVLSSITHQDGSKSEGTFADDILVEGVGRLVTGFGKNVDMYNGKVYKGKAHGVGKKIYADGSIAEGNFDNGDFKSGTYQIDGVIYKGEFKNRKLTGPGIKIEGGLVYDGIFSDGLMNGYGRILSSDKVVQQEGEYIDDIFQE